MWALGRWTPKCERRSSVKDMQKMTSSFISQWICTFNIQSMVSFANLRFHVEKFHTYLISTTLDCCGDHLTDFKMNVAFDQPYRNSSTERTTPKKQARYVRHAESR